MLRLLRDHWQGRHGLLASTALPVVTLCGLWALSTWVFDSVDWVWHHRSAAVASAVIIVLLVAAAVWGVLGVARSALRADARGESHLRVYLPVTVVLALAVGTAGQFGLSTNIWLRSLWSIATGPGEAAEVWSDPKTGRMVIRGSLGLGTSLRVREVLSRSRGIRLVELHSSGGVAIEGLALARLLEAHAVDTLVLKTCSSACVTAFAAGERRYLGPNGRLGLHSAGPSMREWRLDVDAEHAAFLERRGVARWLIEAERATANSEILEPATATLLGSGLVTDLWGR
jgi:hypothetical protein